MPAQSPIPFALPFTHYAEYGYQPIPIVWKDKRPAGGDGWNTRSYDYKELDAGQYGVGLLCNNVVGFDIDVDNKALADKIERAVRKSLGLPKSTPVRIGRAPKRLLVARVNAPVKGWDLMHRPEGGKGSTLFQLLGEGKQFVIHGIHPDTGKPYTLDRPLPAHEALPLVTEEQLNALRLELGLLLIDAGYSITGTEGGHAVATGAFSSVARWRSADELRRVVLALKSIPPSVARGEWFKVACALHDGTHGEEDGFEMFHAWSSGELAGERPVNYKSQKDCWQVWRTLKPGKGISTGTLFAMAKDNEERPAPKKVQPAPSSPEEPVTEFTPVEMDASELFDFEAGEVPWVAQDVLTHGAHLLVGRPKGGKSWVTMDMAYAVGSGGSFLGKQCTKARVLWIAGEDTKASLSRRMKVRGERPRNISVMTMESLSEEAKKYPEHTFAAWLGEYLKRNPDVKLVIMDTHATIEARWQQEEIDEKRNASIVAQAYQMSRIYEEVGHEAGACIVLVHHAAKLKNLRSGIVDYHELINLPATVVAGATASLVLADPPDRDIHDEDDHRRVFAFRGRHIINDAPLLIELKDGRATMLGTYREVTQTETQAETMAALEALLAEQEPDAKGERWVTYKQLAQATGKHEKTIAGHFKAMKKDPKKLVWKHLWRVELKASKGVRLVAL